MARRMTPEQRVSFKSLKDCKYKVGSFASSLELEIRRKAQPFIRKVKYKYNSEIDVSIWINNYRELARKRYLSLIEPFQLLPLSPSDKEDLQDFTDNVWKKIEAFLASTKEQMKWDIADALYGESEFLFSRHPNFHNFSADVAEDMCRVIFDSVRSQAITNKEDLISVSKKVCKIFDDKARAQQFYKEAKKNREKISET